MSRENNVYVPSSALLGDIKSLTDAPSQVLVIMEKSIDTEIYSTVKHVTKGLNLNTIIFPEKINRMINLDNYVS